MVPIGVPSGTDVDAFHNGVCSQSRGTPQAWRRRQRGSVIREVSDTLPQEIDFLVYA